MPTKKTMQRARRDQAQGKSASTQAGEFVREEIHHVREGKHGARSAQQAIAIGLSKARRAGVDLPPQPKRSSAKSKRPAAPARGRSAASHAALSRQAKSAATRRGPAQRKAAARKAATTRRHRSHA